MYWIGFGRVMIGLAAVTLVTGVSRADSGGAPGYRCTADDFRYTQEIRGTDFKDRWVTRIGFTKDGKVSKDHKLNSPAVPVASNKPPKNGNFTKDRKLTWSVDAHWEHPGEGFVAKGSTTVTLDGFGLYSVPMKASSTGTGLVIDELALQAAASVEQVGEDFPNIQFEPLNYGVYPKARGLITPVTADIYQGCPAEPPTDKPLTVHVCSDMELPIFGGDVAQPSVPRYAERTFCASFNFTPVTLNGIATPAVTDAIFSPVDFVDLSRDGSPSLCRYTSAACSTSASCEPNPCVLDPATPGYGTCKLGETATKPWIYETVSNKPASACRIDEDCAVDQCERPDPQRPSSGTFYGVRLTLVTSGSVESGDEQRLAELMEPMWNRRTDATARGLVHSKLISERRIGDAKVERTVLYLFELSTLSVPGDPNSPRVGTGVPMTFITRWD